ncbi:MAG: carboxypeptidase regulatory-like domain-containing protein [Acidobacteriota bacterium]|nr:MAG: carboxypeptidase regulatory-like domain-containing protein [Acidobacteriota bacterium]
MKVTLILAAVLFLSAPLSAFDGCKVLLPDSPERTRDGANFTVVVYDEEELPFLQVKGKVSFWNGQPAANVMVELFDNPEWMGSKGSVPDKEQKRIGVCITSEDGEFFIPGIPKGVFELRISKDGGFARTHRLIKVDPEAEQYNLESLEVQIELGN